MKIKSTLVYREARYIWRAFFVYGRGLTYLNNRYIVGPRIKHKGVLDRPVETDKYSVHILCSHKDLIMLLWSLASWYRVLPKGMAGQVYVHEDGSFNAKDKKILNQLFPSSQIVEASFCDNKVTEWLSSYPTAKKFRFRKDIPLMRKLIDPYFTGGAPNRLILDTDIVWFDNPEELISCIGNNKTCVTKNHVPMKGVVSENLNENEKLVNSGVVAYSKGDLNLGKVDNFLNLIGNNFFGHHVEQAAYAYALFEPIFLPFERYSLKSYEGQVMRHYTGPVREKFWFEGVKRIKDSIL